MRFAVNHPTILQSLLLKVHEKNTKAAEKICHFPVLFFILAQTDAMQVLEISSLSQQISYKDYGIYLYKPKKNIFALLGTLMTFTCLDFRASMSHDRFYTADCLLIEYSNSASNSTF